MTMNQVSPQRLGEEQTPSTTHGWCSRCRGVTTFDLTTENYLKHETCRGCGTKTVLPSRKAEALPLDRPLPLDKASRARASGYRHAGSRPSGWAMRYGSD